jgi:hypothetical protein
MDSYDIMKQNLVNKIKASKAKDFRDFELIKSDLIRIDRDLEELKELLDLETLDFNSIEVDTLG